MSLLNGLLSNSNIQNIALGQLKKFMRENGVTLAALAPKEKDSSGMEFDLFHFMEPVTIITNVDLATYKSAVAKCIEHGIEF